MARATVHIRGLRDVERALRELPKATGKAAMRKVLGEGGEPIAQAARAMVPIAEGNLRESIDVSPKLSRAQRRASRRSSRSFVEMHVGAGSNPQSITQEFGTFKEPAQPFMRPAWESERQNALVLIRDSLWGEIDKAAARVAMRRAFRHKEV